MVKKNNNNMQKFKALKRHSERKGEQKGGEQKNNKIRYRKK